MPIVGRTKLVGRTVVDWMGAEWLERWGSRNRTRTQQHDIYIYQVYFIGSVLNARRGSIGASRRPLKKIPKEVLKGSALS